MRAYVPLSAKMFGSPAAPAPLRLSFMASLVLSRLLYAGHIFVPAVRYVRELTNVYMRLLWRIFDAPSFGLAEQTRKCGSARRCEH